MPADLFGALTSRQILGSGQHSTACLARRGNRETEVWANLVSVAGSGDFGAKVLDRFAPRSYDALVSIVRETYGSD